MRREPLFISIGLVIAGLLTIGCGGRTSTTRIESPKPASHQIRKINFTIQVGAFSNVDNAVRLTERLSRHRVDAYHFVDESGLYKVRFGAYDDRGAAQDDAEALRRREIIAEYYIVSLQPLPIRSALQEQLVKTAETFIGIPYKWGGDSPTEGFDCSGLTMTVYKLNGLELPRSSRQQWKTGRYIRRHRLKKGDLVFFATTGGRRVSHVGIYAGANRFIHAPRKGRDIRYASLNNRYYRSRYIGARRYI